MVLDQASPNTMPASVSLNTTTGILTLQPGTYELEGSLGGLGPVGGTSQYAYAAFFNHNLNNFVGTGGVSTAGDPASTRAMPMNAASVVLTVTSPTNISLRVNAISGATQIGNPSDFRSNGALGRAWVTVIKY